MSTQTDAQTMPLDELIEDIERRRWRLEVSLVQWAEAYLAGVNGSFESDTRIETTIRMAYQLELSKTAAKDEAA